MAKRKGGFTLPGEAGYEKLTLEMAEKWGADVIRDSDGTELSSEILDAGYGIYSTICLIRDHNEWARSHPDKLQQTFLCTQPLVAQNNILIIDLMKDFFEEQFRVNCSKPAMRYWQVYDRTTNEVLSPRKWFYDASSNSVTITEATPWHKYTVSFLAYRIWEEISMYNHTTNHWEKEHLMQLDPIYTETQEYLYEWLKNWCETHPSTTVVRFTSMFYNFVWIWGSDPRNPYLFSDWASYDFTVSPAALDRFARQYGYRLNAEDFINQEKLHVTHMPPNSRKIDWMHFINDFVIRFGRRLVKLVHQYGKQAYVFYDDSWIGVEPYGRNFSKFGFDGLIKCVFSGYEARLCSGVHVPTHELRLHPYLFPVGLGGAPTFMEGGNPTLDAKKYWNHVRRALLRQPVDRIGLGGYLHLTQDYPDFCDYIEKISDEFRDIRDYHKEGGPLTFPTRVAVLHCWGSLRSWTLSGHFHETYMHDLIHINEALSGLPFEVSFISFEDVQNGALKDVDVVINAGFAGSAWSGGSAWENPELVTELTRFVAEGGAFIGVDEPSAVPGFDTYFRMAHVLGIDEDTGDRVCHGRWAFETETIPGLIPEGAAVKGQPGLYLTDGKARVLMEQDGLPTMTVNSFGKGLGIYLSHFSCTLENTRLLMNLLLMAGGEDLDHSWTTDTPQAECAYYPGSGKLVVFNNSDCAQDVTVRTEGSPVSLTLEPYDTQVIDL